MLFIRWGNWRGMRLIAIVANIVTLLRVIKIISFKSFSSDGGSRGGGAENKLAQFYKQGIHSRHSFLNISSMGFLSRDFLKHFQHMIYK